MTAWQHAWDARCIDLPSPSTESVPLGIAILLLLPPPSVLCVCVRACCVCVIADLGRCFPTHGLFIAYSYVYV